MPEAVGMVGQQRVGGVEGHREGVVALVGDMTGSRAYGPESWVRPLRRPDVGGTAAMVVGAGARASADSPTAVLMLRRPFMCRAD